MIVFTPLSGSAVSDSTPRPFAHLLQIDDVKVLLDCGSPDWRLGAGEETDGQDEEVDADREHRFWDEYLELLERYVSLTPVFGQNANVSRSVLVQ